MPRLYVGPTASVFGFIKGGKVVNRLFCLLLEGRGALLIGWMSEQLID